MSRIFGRAVPDRIHHRLEYHKVLLSDRTKFTHRLPTGMENIEPLSEIVSLKTSPTKNLLTTFYKQISHRELLVVVEFSNVEMSSIKERLRKRKPKFLKYDGADVKSQIFVLLGSFSFHFRLWYQLHEPRNRQ